MGAGEGWDGGGRGVGWGAGGGTRGILVVSQ